MMMDIATIDPRLKAIYSRFMGECWFDTARPTPIANDNRTWKLIEVIINELRNFRQIEADIQKRIPRDNSVMQMIGHHIFMLQTIFRSKTNIDASESRARIVLDLIKTLVAIYPDYTAVSNNDISEAERRMKAVHVLMECIADGFKHSTVSQEARSQYDKFKSVKGSTNRVSVDGRKEKISNPCQLTFFFPPPYHTHRQRTRRALPTRS
jgi:hypothetical protein